MDSIYKTLKLVKQSLRIVFICLVSSYGSSVSAALEAFEFNDAAGLSFNSFVNTGSNGSQWNWNGPTTVATDGTGNLVIGPNVDGGSFYRKIDYISNPYTSGSYRLEMAVVNGRFAGADTDGNMGFAIGRQLSPASDLAQILYRINEGTPQFRIDIANDSGSTSYNTINSADGTIGINFDIDAGVATVDYNGAEQYSINLPTSRSIGALQFKVQNLDATTELTLDSLRFTQLSTGSASDSDGDGLDDSVETNTGTYVSASNTGTNPSASDTDGDNLSDGAEVNTHGTNPNLTDTDSDGLSDGDEINTHGTDPLDSDSDDDTFSDFIEVQNSTNPNNPSSYPLGTSVIIDAGDRKQKIEGFGASGAWQEASLNNHNNRDEIISKAFDELGLDIFRIQNKYQHITNNVNGTLTYQPTVWINALTDIKDVIDEAESVTGRDIKILMSAWSPPARLKSNGRRDDGGTGDSGTLSSNGSGYQYDEYAQWWFDAYTFYNNQGLDVDYISIQNEPSYDATWNSCRFDPTETQSHAGYNIAFEKTWQKFATELGTQQMPKMIAPEHQNLSGNTYANYIDALGPHYNRIYGYGHHLYQNLNNINSDLLSAKKYDYKPIFQTEYGVDSSANDDITRKLNLATLIHNSFTIENLSAYFHWALWWPSPDGESLIDIPSGNNSTYTLLPEYYAFKHFSAFIHADWRRLETLTTSNDLLISAYASGDRSQMTVVIVNDSNSSENLNLNFVDATVTGGSIYRSDVSNDCVLQGSFSLGDEVSIPSKSITTVTMNTQPPSVVTTPNILFIAIDDLRPQLRCYDEPQMKTPYFDQLAKDSYLFTRAYCQQGVCGPSRASIMTGMRPDTTGAYDFDSDFRLTMPWAITLPMKLSENGYRSEAIGKIYHGTVNDSLSWDSPHSAGGGLYGSSVGGNGNQMGFESYTGEEDALRDGTVAGVAVSNLASLKNQQPFFYGVGFVRPHLPFVAPQSYWDKYDVSDLEFPEMDNEPVNALSYSYSGWAELRNGYAMTPIPSSGPVSASVEQNLIHGYYACVSYVDTQIGRLLDALDAEGLAENTIIVLWGDHGFHLGDHGQWCKHSNFELDARVPLIVKVPWMEGAQRIDSLVELLDVYPTLMELCGIEAPEEIQGQSLVSLMQSPDSLGPNEAVSQYPRGNVMGYSIRTDRYRYTEWRNTAASGGAVVGREIYDHILDPNENTNIATVVTGGSGEIVNLITNGEFDNGDTGWTEVGSSTLSIISSDSQLGSDPLAQITNITGANVYNNKLVQTIAYEAGKTYTIELTARASSNGHGIRVIWLPPGSNQYNNNIMVENPTLTTSAQTLTYSGIVAGTTVSDAQLQIQVGGATSDVYIDSVRIYETGGSSTTEQHPAIASLSAQLTPYIGGAYKIGAGSGDSLATVLANAGLTGNDALFNADPDGDGIDNLTEYALNMSLTQADRSLLDAVSSSSGLPIPAIVEENDNSILAIEYMRRKGADEIIYQPEFGSDLPNDDWSSTTGDETITNIDSDWERVRVEDVSSGATNSSRFGRLRLIFNP